MNTKNNQRFREMDLRMKNAMMNLLREMDFEKITVKKICESAGITDEAEMMYYLVYFQAGFTMVLKRWVDCGCKESEETVTKLLENCVPSVWR